MKEDNYIKKSSRDMISEINEEKRGLKIIDWEKYRSAQCFDTSSIIIIVFIYFILGLVGGYVLAVGGF